MTTVNPFQTFTTTPQIQFLRGTRFTSVAEAIQSGFKTHDQWHCVVEAYKTLERKVQAKERRLTSSLENVTRLDGARYQVLKELAKGAKTYPELHDASELTCSSIHKAVKALLTAEFVVATGNLNARKNRAQLKLTPAGEKLLAQYTNSPELSETSCHPN